ncbi:MAG: hypothetical protein CO150_00025 [Nitrospirae bacterium CG_4_9_14_3_um_filter_53_35]|nr:MAG: hypothetical protein AUK29_05870 [Nitrospirae bacterium CG2_30_53_67]PIV83253.1 MAG: hypothetical protein COW52_09285 [Nitrospirae bacterium CG17_big_fil_post_rev_8_21_14_2_50_50_9]PIX86676.1 MAG: hypothetical protein COZ32_02090 [Nitrospirae bacterium CG_4_10_14_3_um_filter_53_41]PJA77608.1 MAG: hypothetical protein CO150_00025 [Nitrospirae bacterium CG_4_9_14_3_um_filter_53_35]
MNIKCKQDNFFHGEKDMERDDRAPGLKRFFQKLTLLCFQQLFIDNMPVADYVSSLLARFASTDRLYKIKNALGERVEYMVDFLTEANSAMDLQSDRFSPFREREIRQHIGDYTLFMTGIYRDFVVKGSSLKYYMDQGKYSYSTVSEFDRLAEKQGAEIFQDLSSRFEYYSWVLDYMKKVYFKDASVLGPYRASIQSLAEW